MPIKRGDIFYVNRSRSVGSEQQAGRPGIIVSNDKNNAFSNTVEVVYLTTRQKRDLPTHVSIRATGIPSTALCEQVHSIDVQRLADYCGSCSNQEIQALDIALQISLGLNSERTAKSDCTHEKDATELTAELNRIRIQRDMLQKLYDNLIQQTVAFNNMRNS